VPNLFERAYALAKTGDFSNTSEIARQLSREGFEAVELHLAGASIRRELNRLCREAQGRTRGGAKS